MKRSYAWSTSSMSPVARRSRSKPRTTATPSRASTRASLSCHPSSTRPLATGVTQDATISSRNPSVPEPGQASPLDLLDCSRHLHEQALPGPEVVDQHPVAGSDRGSDLAEAQVSNPAH